MIGATFKADQNLRIHQIAIFAEIAANICRKVKGWCGVMGTETAQTLFNFLHKIIVVNATSSCHNHTVSAVLFVHILTKISGRKRHHGIRFTQNGAPDRLVTIGCFGEAVENDIIRRIVGCTDLLHDDLLFALKFGFVELGGGQDVSKNIDGQRHVVAQHASII